MQLSNNYSSRQLITVIRLIIIFSHLTCFNINLITAWTHICYHKMYIAALLVVLNSTTATYAAVLVARNNHVKAFLRLQEGLSYIQSWLKEWRIKPNGTKSIHMAFATRKETCPLTLNSLRIPQAKDARYLENNLDFKREKCTGYSAKNHNSIENKLLLHNAILKSAPMASNRGTRPPI